MFLCLIIALPFAASLCAAFLSSRYAPTMGATLGTGCVLVASMLVSSTITHQAVFHELLIAAFLTMTAPVTAILLMRAARSRTDT
jgi:multicomponent K+:H+ antiporter subunit G